MTIYTIYQRNASTAMTEVIGRASVDLPQVQYSNDLTRQIIEGTNVPYLGETFNPGNPDHWEQLPSIYSGTRLWVVKSYKPKFTFGAI